MIDTLKYTKDLEAAGLNREQAETIVGAQFKMISENVATKTDVNKLELALRSDMNNLKHVFKGDMNNLEHVLKGDMNKLELKLKSDFKELRAEVKSRIEKLDHKLTLENQNVVNKLGRTIIGSVTVLGVFLGLLINFL